MLKITATFLDEISSDIPSQNWGYEEWDRDFQAMRVMGIDTVIMIRCGLRNFITYPSDILINELDCFKPPVDLVDMFLTLAEKHGMNYFFGTYALRHNGDYKDVDFNKTWEVEKRLLDEVWNRYGHRKAFKGWYLSKEIGRDNPAIVQEFIRYSQYCKEISGNLPTLISPGMLGRKSAGNTGNPLDFDHHYKLWDEIMDRISGCVDIVAFQDGHVDYQELPEALKINKVLAQKHGLQCWSNCESFDRDMPFFRFPPIKWEKLLLKLQAATDAKLDKVMTFEFSHFMSPNSFWPQAGNLYKRYMEYMNLSSAASPDHKNIRGMI